MTRRSTTRTVRCVRSLLGSRLTVDSDILALIPEGNPRVDGFKRAVADFA